MSTALSRNLLQFISLLTFYFWCSLLQAFTGKFYAFKELALHSSIQLALYNAFISMCEQTAWYLISVAICELALYYCYWSCLGFFSNNAKFFILDSRQNVSLPLGIKNDNWPTIFWNGFKIGDLRVINFSYNQLDSKHYTEILFSNWVKRDISTGKQTQKLWLTRSTLLPLFYETR